VNRDVSIYDVNRDVSITGVQDADGVCMTVYGNLVSIFVPTYIFG